MLNNFTTYFFLLSFIFFDVEVQWSNGLCTGIQIQQCRFWALARGTVLCSWAKQFFSHSAYRHPGVYFNQWVLVSGLWIVGSYTPHLTMFHVVCINVVRAPFLSQLITLLVAITLRLLFDRSISWYAIELRKQYLNVGQPCKLHCMY